MHRILLLFVVSVIAAGAASAQSLPTPPARLRIATPELGKSTAIGTLLAVRGDTMLMRLEDSADTTALAMSDLTKLEVSTGHRRPIARGLGIGLLAGAAIGVVVGAASGDDREGFISLSAEEKAAVGAVFFGGVGGVAGGIIGATRRVERWQRVSLATARPTIGPGLDGRGIEIAILVRF
jgi:hypothetical protein